MRLRRPLRVPWAPLLALALAPAGSASPTEAGDAARPPGSIDFVGRNLLMTAEGTFHRWRFTRLEIDREHPERSVVEVEVDVASLDTGIERRDDHLRSADFFDVERYPTATIRVEDASRDGESEAGNPRYRARFRIRIRDVEKSVDGHFEVTGRSPPEVEGDLVLNRLDFGVGEPPQWWNPASPKKEIPVHFSTVVPVD